MASLQTADPTTSQVHNTDNGPTRIVIVDGHSMVREGIRLILDNDPDMQVVGEAGDVTHACETVAETRPHIIVLDLNRGTEPALDHVDKIADCSPESRLLVLVGEADEDVSRKAAERGAMGIVLKSEAASTLLLAIRKVRAGEVWFDRSLTAKLISDAHKRQPAEEAPMSRLTPREQEIVAKVSRGLVNKDIAHALGISEKTVRNSLTTVFEKLGVSNRLELALLVTNHNHTHGR